MANFGQILGAFGTAYPQYQQNQQNQQMNNIKIQDAIRQMALEKSNQEAQSRALQGLSTTQGSGPGGIITPQQLAALSNNPSAFNMLNAATRPSNTGMLNIEGRNVSGQYGIDRIAQQGENRMNAVNVQQEGANARNEANIDARKDIVGTQQTNANARNKYSVDNRKGSAANATNLATLPEYKTAKSEFEEAKKDERNIIAHYPNIAQAYSDPQWQDARKRALAAQTKMEAIQTKAQKEAVQQPPAPSQIPPEAIKQLQEGHVTVFGNGQKWTLENGQPKQAQ